MLLLEKSLKVLLVYCHGMVEEKNTQILSRACDCEHPPAKETPFIMLAQLAL